MPPTVYVNQAGFASALDLQPQAAHHRLVNGLLPAPDVYVGHVVLAGKAVPGWTNERVTLYREFVRPFLVGRTGRLRLPAGLELPGWWEVTTEWYLNQKEAAKTLGLEPVSISARRSRGTFPVSPRVTVGDRFHGTANGWDLAELREYGTQDVYLDPSGKVADKGQQGPPRKAIDPGFYQRRQQARAKPAQAA